MNSFLRQSKLFVKRNGATILTCLGGAGVIATTVMAVKATPKALASVEAAEKEKGEELTKLEYVRTVTHVYIPTIVTGTATIACIFGANVLNKRHQASLASAYALIDSSYKEYKAKVKELYGEETHNEIVNSIMVEKAEDKYINSSYLCSNCDLSVEESGSEPRIFYDVHSGRYFESTIERVMNAEYHLNRNYILRGYSYLNEFYDFLGLSPTDYGSVMGWAPADDGMYWIEFNHRKAALNDGTPVYIIDMPFEPTYDFLEY